MFSWVKSHKAKGLTLSAALLAAAMCAAPVVGMAEDAGHYDLGEAATPEQIAGWNIDVRPDGKGLPPGSGGVEQGAQVFETHCASCHGTFGEGMGAFPVLAGGMDSLSDDRPEKTFGSYWPYVTTLWDYINRAMPFYAPQTLSDDQVYALVAYVLNLNNIVDADFVATQDNLASIEMPNSDGFEHSDPRPDTHNKACMEECRDATTIKIVSTTEGKDVTPRTSGPLDTGLSE